MGVGLWFAVYTKGKNAKKYRHGVEHGSARWGNQKDIEPFVDPVFENNVILTQTERLMMGSRPPDPKTRMYLSSVVLVLVKLDFSSSRT